MPFPRDPHGAQILTEELRGEETPLTGRPQAPPTLCSSSRWPLSGTQPPACSLCLPSEKSFLASHPILLLRRRRGNLGDPSPPGLTPLCKQSLRNLEHFFSQSGLACDMPVSLQTVPLGGVCAWQLCSNSPAPPFYGASLAEWRFFWGGTQAIEGEKTPRDSI